MVAPLNIREFMAFRAVMMAGTTTGAARALNLSQPSVSRLINDLEARLRLVLFRRERSRLVPTDEARALLDEVERAFDGLQQLSDFTGRMGTSDARPIRLVISPSLSARFTPAAVAAFTRQYPDVRVFIDMRTAEYAAELIAGDQADLAVSLLPVSHPGVDVVPLIDVPTVCVLPRGHRLAKRTVIRPGDLAQEPLITIARRYPARARLDKVFEASGITPNIRIETSTSAAACGCSAAGLGIALINAFMASEFAASDVVLRRFEPTVPNSFGIIKAHRPSSKAQAAFIAALRKAAIDQVGKHRLI
jgi:DNA-binding transcriptional LysR family regulator